MNQDLSWADALEEMLTWAVFFKDDVTIVGMDLPEQVRARHETPATIIVNLQGYQTCLTLLRKRYQFSSFKETSGWIVGVDGKLQMRCEASFVIEREYHTDERDHAFDC
ncbi:MAG TPA: hypothetical protein VN397_01965 [Candidatus Methylomirabilis sp.]|nr:hypothetical protein [Candidatus Methylomirabilis sp.]